MVKNDCSASHTFKTLTYNRIYVNNVAVYSFNWPIESYFTIVAHLKRTKRMWMHEICYRNYYMTPYVCVREITSNSILGKVFGIAWLKKGDTQKKVTEYDGIIWQQTYHVVSQIVTSEHLIIRPVLTIVDKILETIISS